MISATDLSAMQATLNAALPDSCQVTRKALSSDGMGGQSATWATISTVACRLAPFGRKADESVSADELAAVAEWMLTLPAGTDVTPADRLVVGTRTFEVTAVHARSEEIGRRVLCLEVG